MDCKPITKTENSDNRPASFSVRMKKWTSIPGIIGTCCGIAAFSYASPFFGADISTSVFFGGVGGALGYTAAESSYRLYKSGRKTCKRLSQINGKRLEELGKAAKRLTKKTAKWSLVALFFFGISYAPAKLGQLRSASQNGNAGKPPVADTSEKPNQIIAFIKNNLERSK